ncbi:unnamed protein product [Arctia plantaginis]|uniref:Uncharacterized protein n=1 Tax=Arctia plantaginis TaxID=874455 RepID=A0A8S1A6F4_ARCPL|nr:unnamed protein product [Arctia plantaginis]
MRAYCFKSSIYSGKYRPQIYGQRAFFFILRLGLVEKQKKYFPDIYVPEHWNNVILAARKKKPFKTVEMKRDDFISTKALETNITNRKIDVDRSKVELLKIQWILYN